MKRCPDCAEEIQDAARVCRFCLAVQPLPPPPEREPGPIDARSDEKGMSTAASLAPAIVVAAIVGAMAIYAVVGALKSPSPARADSAARTIAARMGAPDLTPAQTAECRSGIAVARRRGLIRSAQQGVIVVEEAIWHELPWDAKKVYLTCALGAQANGDLSGIIRAVGHRSGRELAGGSPGHGTLRAE